MSYPQRHNNSQIMETKKLLNYRLISIFCCLPCIKAVYIKIPSDSGPIMVFVMSGTQESQQFDAVLLGALKIFVWFIAHVALWDLVLKYLQLHFK